MALRLPRTSDITDELIVAYTEVKNPRAGRDLPVRAGRCAGCRIAIVRPNGGPTWRDLACPICGSGTMQSTWGSQQARGVLLMSRAEAIGVAAGRYIEVEQRLTPAAVHALTTDDLHERILHGPAADLPILNAELKERLQ